MYKKAVFFLIIISGLFFLVGCGFENAQATGAKTLAVTTPMNQNQTYVPLIPDSPLSSGGGSSNGGDIQGLLIQIYKWGISLAVLLAIIFIILGGVQYMTTDSIFNKEEGKQKIISALTGLLIALSSWVILNQINENIFKADSFNKLKALNIIAAPGTRGKIDHFVDSSNVTYDGNSVDWSGEASNPERITMDTDGQNPPPFPDSSYLPETSYKPGGVSLDANKDIYIAVPTNSVPLGTKVKLTNKLNGKVVYGVVGDYGGTRGQLEISYAGLVALGVPITSNDVPNPYEYGKLISIEYPK